MIISHRGKGTGLPENSIAAFEAAFQAGAEGIECDLRMTADHRVLVQHGGTFGPKHRRIGVRWHPYAALERIAQQEGEPLFPIEELFQYIAQRTVPFYLELKDPSPSLSRVVLDLIRRGDLWDRASVLGFPGLIQPAIRLQREYPRLRTCRILLAPVVACARFSLDGTGVFFGWQDSVPASERIFRKTITPERLARLVEHCRQGNSPVVAGVINRPEGFSLFRAAGIRDVVTDDVAAAQRDRHLNTSAVILHQLPRDR